MNEKPTTLELRSQNGILCAGINPRRCALRFSHAINSLRWRLVCRLSDHHGLRPGTGRVQRATANLLLGGEATAAGRLGPKAHRGRDPDFGEFQRRLTPRIESLRLELRMPKSITVLDHLPKTQTGTNVVGTQREQRRELRLTDLNVKFGGDGRVAFSVYGAGANMEVGAARTIRDLNVVTTDVQVDRLPAKNQVVVAGTRAAEGQTLYFDLKWSDQTTRGGTDRLRPSWPGPQGLDRRRRDARLHGAAKRGCRGAADQGRRPIPLRRQRRPAAG